jgi:hypothetical protein
MKTSSTKLFDLSDRAILSYDKYQLIVLYKEKKESQEVHKLFFSTTKGVIKGLERKGIELSQDSIEKILALKTYYKNGEIIVGLDDF